MPGQFAPQRRHEPTYKKCDQEMYFDHEIHRQNAFPKTGRNVKLCFRRQRCNWIY